MSESPLSLVPGLERVYERSLDCVHCGLCLSSCPTYLATGRETSSPRGRIYLMRGVAEGRVETGPLLVEEAYLCLGCRACETACPSGVRYGEMLELLRDELTTSGRRSGFAAWLERTLLRHVVAVPGRLRAAMSALALVQRLRLDSLGARLLPGRAAAVAALAPRVPGTAARAPLPELTPAVGEQRGRVALFTGCIMAESFGEVHRATLRVLAANGFEVVVPPAQGCCGALHAHSGDLDFARGLARHNVGAFDELGIDAIVVNSAGCGAAMREAPSWLGDAASRFAGRVRDVCEWLDDVGLRPPRVAVSATVCYDDPCHLVHGQGVAGAPRRLLASIDGLTLVDHAEAGACCGAAGIYNLTQPVMAQRVLSRKLDALERVDPDWIATGNPGCMIQLAAGARARGLRARVAHPIELLDAAYGGPGQI
jgi:glycolate oxidase iron-sulfur subunit